ncbi:MAG TPA: zinc-dependent alcohol dehydrogenase family protein [Candidatus Angelobacter sp.]|nr:zinc-dependent alcohol dehydrogenase family protein [Candidatus Angelobacter sp.]
MTNMSPEFDPAQQELGGKATEPMKACLLKAPAKIETNPLEFVDVAVPEPGGREVLVRVRACGVCRTDLHVIEGELPTRKSPVIPGHQVIGTVEKLGKNAGRFPLGTHVGIAWLHKTDGTCEYCRAGAENLCDHPEFTGYSVNGGYAEYIVAPETFVYAIPEGFAGEQAAPLLCAGIIGFRCLRISGIKPGGKLGFYGFGAAAHVAIQVARHWGVKVYASTRDVHHQKLALELGAAWAGGTFDEPPKKLDSAIVFAPAGEIVPAALRALKKGGVLVLGGIHMSTIPSFDYDLLYQERVIRSVANNTRQDGEDFLRVAAEIPIRTRVQIFPLQDANRALNALKNDAIPGAAVLRVTG